MAKSNLETDSSGFILGKRRLKEMSDGISKTEENTRQILDFMRKSKKTPIDSTTAGNPVVRDVIESSKTTTKAVKQVVDATAEVKTVIKKALDAEKGLYKPNPSSSPTGVKERANEARKRDANGRFSSANGSNGSGGSSDPVANKKGFIKSIKEFFTGNNLGGGNVRGVDPTIDALGELKDVVAPVGGVFGRMSAKTISLFTGRRRKAKNEEAIPEEQSKANKEKFRLGFRLNKLVERLIDVSRAKNGGGLLGVLGKGKGLLGMLLGGGKAVLKKVPLLGALFGGGMLAKDWGKLDSGGKGKGIGQIVGTVVGGALGSFLGIGGTIGGGALGNYLGGIFGEKVGKWTDELRRVNFADIFRTAVGGIGGGIVSAGDYVAEKLGFGGKDSAKVSKNSEERQKMMYNALRKAGFDESQALAIGGEIGRENDYSDKMFGTHIDPAKSKGGKDIVNSGVLSWNNKRGENFRKHMRSRGLMDEKGNMPHTQEALDAQADFIMQEMKSSAFKDKMGGFLSGDETDPKKSAVPLAKYIGWARGQSTIRGANGTRVPFDSGKHEAKINAYIERGKKLARNQKGGSATVKKVEEIKVAKVPYKPTPFKEGTARPAPIKIPKISPELAKHGSNSSFMPTTGASSDANINQSVSDRGIAHVLSGGLGFRE